MTVEISPRITINLLPCSVYGSISNGLAVIGQNEETYHTSKPFC